MRIQRLKDKLGNRSNASSEVEYDGALAWLVGEPGRGIATIIEMVSATGWTACWAAPRRSGRPASRPPHYARHRRAFGAPADRPAGHDRRARRPDPGVGGGHRAGAPAGRGGRPRRRAGTRPRRRSCGWPCRRPSTGCASGAPGSPPRRWSAWAATATSRTRACRGCYRDAPLNSDLGGLGQRHRPGRAPRAGPHAAGSADALLAEIDRGGGRRPAAGRGRRPAARRARRPPRRRARRAGTGPAAGRPLIDRTCRRALLARHAPAAVADAFCASRLGPARGRPRAGRPVRHAARTAWTLAAILVSIGSPPRPGRVGGCNSGREPPTRSVPPGTGRAPTSPCSPRSPSGSSCACSTTAARRDPGRR